MHFFVPSSIHFRPARAKKSFGSSKKWIRSSGTWLYVIYDVLWKHGIFILLTSSEKFVMDATGVPLLLKFHKVCQNCHLARYYCYIDGFDSSKETCDLTMPQTHLIECCDKIALLNDEAYEKWFNEILLPMRLFILGYWNPMVHAARPLETTKMIWYEERYAFLLFAVIYMHFERLHWHHRPGNATREPTLDDVPQALVEFCLDIKTYGIDGWAALRTEMRGAHLEKCRRVHGLLETHFTLKHK